MQDLLLMYFTINLIKFKSYVTQIIVIFAYLAFYQQIKKKIIFYLVKLINIINLTVMKFETYLKKFTHCFQSLNYLYDLIFMFINSFNFNVLVCYFTQYINYSFFNPIMFYLNVKQLMSQHWIYFINANLKVKKIILNIQIVIYSFHHNFFRFDFDILSLMTFFDFHPYFLD